MAPNNSTAERDGNIDFTMDPSQYLELVIESLTHVETTVQLLRTPVTILYKHATFDSNQKIQTPNMMQLNTSRIAMASVNASLKPTRAQKPKPKPKPSRSTMINRNFGNENTQHSTDRTLRYSKEFVNGLNKKGDATLIRAGNNTYADMFVAGVLNPTENSKQFTYESILVNNTDNVLEQIHQMEIDMSIRNKALASDVLDGEPSTEVNVNNDHAMIIENGAETVPETAPATEPRAASAPNTVKSVEEKADATMMVDINRAANVPKPRIDSPLTKGKVKISTEKVLQVLRCKGRAAAKGKMRTIMQRRSSNGTHRRSSVEKRRSSIARIYFERKMKSIEPTPNAKPYKCVVDGCSYAGAQKRYLTAHIKRHNNEIETQIGRSRCTPKT